MMLQEKFHEWRRCFTYIDSKEGQSHFILLTYRTASCPLESLTDEGPFSGVTRRSIRESYRFVALDQTSKALKGFVPIRSSTWVTAVLLPFRPEVVHAWKIQNMDYRAEINAGDSSNGY